MRFPRSSGVLLHPTSLPGPHGSGDLGPDARHFIDWLVAGRETAELRAEEAQRGRALAELLVALDLADARPW